MANLENPSNVEFRLNRGSDKLAPGQLGSQIVRRKKQIFKGVYDFAIQGGGIGTIPLYDPVYNKKQPLLLPPSFIVTKVMIDVLTAPTSGGSATLALTSGKSAGDLLAALAVASFTGLLDGIPVGTAATSFKILAATTAGSGVALVVATAALTAGKFNVHIEGYLSDAQ